MYFGIIEGIKAIHKAEKDEQKIAMLEREERSKARQLRWTYTFIALLIGFAIIVIRLYLKNRGANKLVQKQKERIEWHNMKLKEANQAKDKMFQIISHDLRSPLATVSNISKLVPIYTKQSKYSLLNETSKKLEESIGQVINLTDNLLAWSQNESGDFPYKPVVISLKNLLANSLRIYESAANNKNIRLELKATEDVSVLADRQMLETVLRNLINNSIKFTPEGGLVILGAAQKKDHTEIWIKDNGVGIPAEQLPKIFDLNNKLSCGTKGEKGSGLGLTLCKGFISQNKGEIWAESIEGVGSTFRFTVPNACEVHEEETEPAVNSV